MQRVALGLLCALGLVTQAHAQNVRVRGSIEQMNGATMTVKTREGETLKINLSDDAKVVAIVKATLADIKPNSCVGSTAMPEENGRWRAVEVHIFPEAMRGTGEGDRPFDYKPKSKMTNGTVNNVGKSSTAGTVTKEDGTSLTLKFKDGEKHIDIASDTVIVTYADGHRDELKAGAAIYITAATKQPDGTFMTNRVNVGRGVVPPM